jgi:hypothetical protein
MNEEPLVRVVRGAAGPEETAALVAVLLARSSGADAAPRAARSAWAASGRPYAGPRSWRESALPR